ncbi:hypothetical protein BD560DRAFT_409378 [Blakeslea trispora]|nr:hypothetical protein BD560DRAFT_409378 [Blakeslea trispora]
MDLSTFQLVDAMNDMDMLRSLSNQQEEFCNQEQQRQQQQQQHATSTDDSGAYEQFQGDINILFQQNHTSNQHMNNFLPFKNNAPNNTSNQVMVSPHYSRPSSATIRGECFDQQEVYNSKNTFNESMTPSFNYQMPQSTKHNFSSGNDMTFSPLSSPAILPQMDRQQKQSSFPKKGSSSNDNSRLNEDNEQYEDISMNEICEQYEQLEQAKLLITQKLSQLQKTQNQHLYNNNQFQHHLMSSSGPKNLTKSGTQQSHLNNISVSAYQNMSEPSSPLQSPHMEPATPASLMNMKVNNSIPSKLQFSSSNRAHSIYANRNISQPQPPSALSVSSVSTPVSVHFDAVSTTTAAEVNAFQSPVAIHDKNMIVSPMLTPTAIMSNPVGQSAPPPSPLALHPRKQSVRSSTKSERQTRHKKQRRESADSKVVNGIHSSPRALKPLLISPTLNPGPKPLPNAMLGSVNSSNSSAASGSKGSAVHSVEDAEHILATRSNYQNLMEGKGAALGIAFSTQIKSGLEVRRTAHKAAEQKRRDSLKEWFDRLRHEVEEGYVKRQKTLMSQIIKEQELEKAISSKKTGSANTEDDQSEDTSSSMKPLSKVLLLQYAYEYIASLKSSLEEKDAIIKELTGGNDKSTHCGLKRKQSSAEEESSHQTCRHSPGDRSLEEMETIIEEDHTTESG